MIPQVLVRWSHLPLELSSWEDEVALRQEFSQAPAWGQASFQERGDVTTEDIAAEEGEKTEGIEAGSLPTSRNTGPTKVLSRPPRQKKANVRLTGLEWAK